MKATILILGGYGVFGQLISTSLSKDADINLLIAGRDSQKAKAYAATIGATGIALDVHTGLKSALEKHKPSLVVNCCGPFQGQDYSTAHTCMEHGIHYIDLADGREYVTGFSALNALAKQKKVVAVTGASTLPALSSAIIDHFLTEEFSEIHTLDYGVSPGNRTERGVATVAAILSYVGKPFTTLVNSSRKTIHGWHDLHRQPYPQMGARWMSNCDVPDLALFPIRYPALKTQRFYAGLELSLLHVGLWLLSWPARFGWVENYAPYASLMRRISLWFYHFGSDTGGMYIIMHGLDKAGSPKNKTWYIIARDGHGPQIPATPATVIARKIMAGALTEPGAYDGMGLISKDEVMQHLSSYSIKEIVQ